MKTTLKKSLSLVLAFFIAVSILSISVFMTSAATGSSTVTTLAELKNALTSAQTITVAENITIDEAITIPADVTVTVTDGKSLYVTAELKNDGTIDGEGTVEVQTIVYVVEEREKYNVTATKNGSISGTGTVTANKFYTISLDGGNNWFADTTGGKAQAVTVKTDGSTVVSASFSSAFTSAKTGETVHMLKDAYVQSTNPKKNNGPLRSYYGLILEGNGHTIYTNLESNGASNEYATIKFTSYLAGTGPDVRPVLKNVTIDSQKNAKADLDFVSGDVTFTVTLYNVNLLGNCQWPNFAWKSNSFIINKSSVNIYDCSIPSWDTGSAKAINFYSGEYSLSLNNKCTVYGGTYTKDPTNYLADGFVAVKDDTTGTYSIAKEFKINLASTLNGSVTASHDTASAGTPVTLTVTPDTGYVIDAILVNGVSISGETFTMPEKDVVVSVTFIKSTSTANAQILGKVNLEGASLKAEQFRFELRDRMGNVVATSTNDENGVFRFPSTRYKEPVVQSFTVVQVATNAAGITYDKSVFSVTVYVSYNAQAELKVVMTLPRSIEFENEYKAKAINVNLAAKVALEGDVAETAPQFKLNLRADNGSIIETLTTAANENVTFSKLTFTKAGTYTYYIEQVRRKVKDLTYDVNIRKITVTVIDNGNGTLTAKVTGNNVVFNNTIKAK